MWRPKFWFSWCKPCRHASIHSPHYPAEQEDWATVARKGSPKLLQMRRGIHKRKCVPRNAPRLRFVLRGKELYIHGCCQISTSEGSLSRSMANLRRLRLHLRTVWSGDTRSILLQPMGRMERSDSRPRRALIHRESGSPPDYLHTPGSECQHQRAHFRPSSFAFAPGRPRTPCALCAHAPTLTCTRVETLLELMQGIFICSEPRHRLCGRKERCRGVTAEEWLWSSSAWHSGCIIPSRSRQQNCADVMVNERKRCSHSDPSAPNHVQWGYCFTLDSSPVCMFQKNTAACSSNLLPDPAHFLSDTVNSLKSKGID